MKKSSFELNDAQSITWSKHEKHRKQSEVSLIVKKLDDLIIDEVRLYTRLGK